MNHVFISYHREDSDFAEALMGKIQAAGFTAWMDTETLRAGEDWRDEIDEAIRGAFAVIIVLTPDAKASEYVTFEWAYALGAGIKVIPALLKPTESHPRLANLQYLDFTNRRRVWSELIQELQTTLAVNAPQTVPVSPDAPPVIKQAARALDSLEEQERKDAINSLGQMNHPAAIEVLAGAVRHPVQDVRILAAFALSDLKDARALPGLIEAIRCRHKEMGPWRLSNCGTPAVPCLLEALKDKDGPVRAAAAAALGPIGDLAALPALTAALCDNEPNVRAAAAEALGELRNAAGLPAIKEALHDPDSSVRLALVNALGRIGGTEAVRALLEFARDEDRDVRHMAVCRLGEIGSAEAVPGLIEALRDKNVNVRAYAAKGLGKIGGTRAVPGLVQAAQDEELAVTNRAFAALEKIGDATAVAGLAGILRDGQTRQRREAARSLGNIGNRAAVPDLLHALRDKSDGVQECAAGALAQIRDPAAVPNLIELLNDENEMLRRSAAQALKQIGTTEALAAAKQWHLRQQDG